MTANAYSWKTVEEWFMEICKVLENSVDLFGWGLSPHASSFKLKFIVSKTLNSAEFSSECLLEIYWKSDLLIC